MFAVFFKTKAMSIIKNNPNEKPSKEYPVDFFAKAFVNFDLGLIADALHDDGLYDRTDKQNFLSDLSRLFKSFQCVTHSIQPFFGIATYRGDLIPAVEFHIEFHTGIIISSFSLYDHFGNNRGYDILVLSYGIISDEKRGIFRIIKRCGGYSMREIKYLMECN
jgi:hypothetical protein